MADSAEPLTRRYSAFISYSHADAKAVRKLHRRLETYRLPSRLASGPGAGSRRLKPVFRDGDEMSATPDMTEAVRQALADADYLIVACSPAAAKSAWVAREIELFHALHGERNILAALVDGEPETSFPPALLNGAQHASIQPLAADFRPGASDRRLAFLRLVAPLAGVHLDDLVHRDGQRRMRQLMAGSAGALAAVAVVAALSVFALNARNEAAVQARRANGLGDFMVSDLRKGLEAAGRHDLLKQVNEAALKSYETADLSKLTPEQIIQLAKGLQGAAKDAEKAGDLGAAQAKTQAAYHLTAALLTAKPNDPKRIFAQAQSEYWVGFISWRAGNAAAARAGFERYAALADRLVATDRANNEWAMERVYAAQDLGMLALRQAGDALVAERYFRASLAAIEPILRRTPGDADALSQRQTDLGWLADSQRLQGRLDEAAATRESQGQVLASMLAKSPRSVEVKRYLLFHDLAVARIAAQKGDAPRALSLLEAGHRRALELAAEDPDNKDFPKQARMFELFEARLWLDPATHTRPPLSRTAKVLGDCAPRLPGAGSGEIGDFCETLLARLRIAQGDSAGAAAALATVQQHLSKQHDVLTARWGLDLAAEARPVQVAMGGAK